MTDVLLGEDEEGLTLHVLFESFPATRTGNGADPLTLKCLEFL